MKKINTGINDISKLINSEFAVLINKKVDKNKELVVVSYDVLATPETYDMFDSYLMGKGINKKDIIFPVLDKAMLEEQNRNYKFISLAFNDAKLQVHLTIYKN